MGQAFRGPRIVGRIHAAGQAACRIVDGDGGLDLPQGRTFFGRAQAVPAQMIQNPVPADRGQRMVAEDFETDRGLQRAVDEIDPHRHPIRRLDQRREMARDGRDIPRPAEPAQQPRQVRRSDAPIIHPNRVAAAGHHADMADRDRAVHDREQGIGQAPVLRVAKPGHHPAQGIASGCPAVRGFEPQITGQKQRRQMRPCAIGRRIPFQIELIEPVLEPVLIRRPVAQETGQPAPGPGATPLIQMVPQDQRIILAAGDHLVQVHRPVDGRHPAAQPDLQRQSRHRRQLPGGIPDRPASGRRDQYIGQPVRQDIEAAGR